MKTPLGTVIFAALVMVMFFITLNWLFAGPALGQQTYHPIPPSMQKAFESSSPLLDQLAAQTAAQLGAAAGGAKAGIAPANLMQRPIVISFGRGGRVDEHRQQFAIYQSRKAKVEIRGPCYSACTLVLAYVEPERLCIAEGGFMAFHAIRSMEHGEKMPSATRQFVADMPELVQLWIEAKGGWQALPLDGYWTLHDRHLWAMGYPKCN